MTGLVMAVVCNQTYGRDCVVGIAMSQSLHRYSEPLLM
jgi:hypothetical protein